MKQITALNGLYKPMFALVFSDHVCKSFLIVLIVLLISVPTFGQDLLWLKQMAGASPNDSSPSEVVTDNSGNV